MSLVLTIFGSLVLLLAGCTNANDACEGVCVTLFESESADDPMDHGEAILCNRYGLSPGVCPEGTACGEVTIDEYDCEVRYCEPIEDGPLSLSFDIHSPPNLDEIPTFDVALTMTMNGGAWPVAAEGRNAGFMTLFLEDGRRIGMGLPADGMGTMQLELPAGRHPFSISFWSSQLDFREFPTGSLRGALEVVSSGQASIDIKRHLLQYEVRVDGVVSPPENGLVEVRATPVIDPFPGFANDPFWSPSAHEPLVEGARGQLALQPGVVYALSAAMNTTGQVPAGSSALAATYKGEAGERNETFALSTRPVSGTLTLDGAGLDAEVAENMTLSIGGHRVPIEPGEPATFATRVYQGPTTVYVERVSATRPELPRGRVILHEGELGDGPLDLAVTSTRVSGRVMVNGEQLSDVGVTTGVRVTPEEMDSFYIALAPEGPAEYEVVLFDGPSYDLSIVSGPLAPPPHGIVVADDVLPQDGLLDLDLKHVEQSFVLTHNGQEPPEGGDNRGELTFTRKQNGKRVSRSVTVPALGEARVFVELPIGPWEVRYDNKGDNGMPRGGLSLGSIEVSGESEHSVDVASRPVSIAITRDGERPPEVADDEGRGKIGFSTLYPGISLPGTGAATITTDVIRGTGSLRLDCFSNDTNCTGALVPDGEIKSLVTGLRL